MTQKKRKEVTREDLAELIEEELGKGDEKRVMSRRKFLKRGLQAGTVGAIALATLGYGYAAYRLADFLDNNPRAARMVENIALEADLVGDYCGLGKAGVRARKILKRNEGLKAEYKLAIAETKAAQLELQNAQLNRAAAQAEKLMKEFQGIHNQYAAQFEQDQGDLGLLARRSKAIAFDTGVNLDLMLEEIKSGTATKLVGIQRRAYKLFGDAAGVPQLTFNQKKINAFKKKYESLVDTIKEIQTNKRQVEAVDDKFEQTGSGKKVSFEYTPWVDYCKKRVQLERTYIRLRRVENGMHEISDWTTSKKDVKRYTKQVEYWRKRQAELDRDISANVDQVRQYTGKEISSDNMFDDFKKKVRRYIFYAAAGASVLTAGALGYGYKKTVDVTGLGKDRIDAREYKDLAAREKGRNHSRRDLFRKTLGFLKGEK